MVINALEKKIEQRRKRGSGRRGEVVIKTQKGPHLEH